LLIGLNVPVALTFQNVPAFSEQLEVPVQVMLIHPTDGHEIG
jgi:hypothetical protein